MIAREKINRIAKKIVDAHAELDEVYNFLDKHYLLLEEVNGKPTPITQTQLVNYLFLKLEDFGPPEKAQEILKLLQKKLDPYIIKENCKKKINDYHPQKVL